MRHLKRVFGLQFQNGRGVVLPHLYFTYLFMSLVSSAVYHILGREVLVSLFSWYYLNGVDQVLMGVAILELLVRIPFINKKEIQ